MTGTRRESVHARLARPCANGEERDRARERKGGEREKEGASTGIARDTRLGAAECRGRMFPCVAGRLSRRRARVVSVSPRMRN